MNTKRVLCLSALILGNMLLAGTYSYAQADPEWLRNWAEAQEHRPAVMSSRSTIATKGEPGTPFVVHGTVLNPNGKPANKVVVHAYHRDHDGYDFDRRDKKLTTWRLQGWAQTDVNGTFEFETIRPAPDHLHREGAHLHFTLESEQFGRQWATKIFLSDDPSTTVEMKQRAKKAGLFGAVRNVKTIDGIQHIDVRFKLKNSADF